jgi:hypothetical protein
MSTGTPAFDMNEVKASILKHIGMLRPFFPKRAVVSVGEFASNLILKSNIPDKDINIFTFFVKKMDTDNSDKKKMEINLDRIIGVNEKVDTHYWYNVREYVSKNDSFLENLKSKPLDKLDGAIFVAATSEGIGSALLPDLASLFEAVKVDSVAIAVFPSPRQPADAHFNALWSMAECARKNFAQVLIDRDSLEDYVGVDRSGRVLKGNVVLNYLLELALSNELFVQEFSELSKSFNLKMFTILAATGASLRVYGSFKNILESTLLRKFSRFDLSSATMLYVIARIPVALKDKFSRSQIELIVDEWFEKKTNLKSVFVSEPILVNDGSDRLDVLMLVGGFDLNERVSSTNRKVDETKNYAEKNDIIKEREWQKLINGLLD